MKKQITNVSIFQSSKVMACFYFLLTAIIMIPMAVLAALGHHDSQVWTWLVLPFVYLIVTYILSIIMFWIYNGMAKLTGGLEITLEDK